MQNYSIYPINWINPKLILAGFWPFSVIYDRRKEAEKQREQEEKLLEPFHLQLFLALADVYEQTNDKSLVYAPDGVRVGINPGETVRMYYPDGDNILYEIHNLYARHWFKLYPTNTYALTVNTYNPTFGQYYQEYSDPKQTKYLHALFSLLRRGDKILPEIKQTLSELKNISTPADAPQPKGAQNLIKTIKFLREYPAKVNGINPTR